MKSLIKCIECSEAINERVVIKINRECKEIDICKRCLDKMMDN